MDIVNELMVTKLKGVGDGQKPSEDISESQRDTSLATVRSRLAPALPLEVGQKDKRIWSPRGCCLV